MKSVCRVALALFVPVAALAAETIAFERYQTIIDRQPFGQPPPGFNPSQMASEVQKGVAAAAEVELTVEQQELQKVVGFSVLNRNGEDYWVRDPNTGRPIEHVVADDSHRTGIGPSAGFGAFYHLTDSWSLRAEARAALAVDSPCGMDYSILAGVQYSFGD